MHDDKNRANPFKKFFRSGIDAKLTLFFILTATIPILIQFFASNILLSAQFREIQNERVMTTYGNIMTALENEMSNLYSDAVDYAHWSDMYEGVANPSREWFDDMFSIASSPQKGITLIYVIGLDGSVVYKNENIEGFFDDCKDYLNMAGRGKEFVTVSGIGDKLYILSFVRIMDTERTEKTNGILVFGKVLNGAYLGKFPKGYNFQYDLLYNGTGLSGKKYDEKYRHYIEAPGQNFVEDKENREQYFKLNDYLGKPVALLHIRETSNFLDRVMGDILRGLATAVAVTFVLIILFINTMKNNILQPIRSLRQKVQQLRHNDHGLLNDNGDEIAQLTEELEAMSSEICKYAKEMEEKNRRLEYLVYRDDITGAYNKRYYRKALPGAFEAAERNNGILSLLIIDIDYFKYYIEQMGRSVGNKTLKKIYGIIIDEVTEACAVCFDGTEEFRIIMPGVDYKAALRTTDFISQKIRESSIPGAERLPRGYISISCGLANYPKDATEYNKLVSAADDRIKRTKQHNQGRIGYFYSIFSSLQDDITENKKSMIYMSKALLSVIDAMDEYTYTHTEGVVKYSVIIANELGLIEEAIDNIRIGALLHDIGKLELGREILNKREKLTEDEIWLIKRHPIFGVNMLRNLVYFDDIVDIVKYHHERYDGGGYPEGLSGERIPLGARIVAVADSFDAMTTMRAYRSGCKSYQDAVAELTACAGKQFDPKMVQALVAYINKNGYNFLLTE